MQPNQPTLVDTPEGNCKSIFLDFQYNGKHIEVYGLEGHPCSQMHFKTDNTTMMFVSIDGIEKPGVWSGVLGIGASWETIQKRIEALIDRGML